MRARFSGLKRTLWIIVPVRGVNQGKSRLASVLEPPQRARLNRWLLRRTLNTLGTWQGDLSRCIVVSGCQQSLHRARAMQAIGLEEPRPNRSLNAIVRYASRSALQRGAKGVLIVPSDLPRLSVAALDRVAALAAAGARAVIAPDRAYSGTNALLLRSASRFCFCFGPDSCAQHLAAAQALGREAVLCRHDDLALDVDTPDDLSAWLSQRSR